MREYTHPADYYFNKWRDSLESISKLEKALENIQNEKVDNDDLVLVILKMKSTAHTVLWDMKNV